ncbi:hypothetical protein LCGC14_0428520 [marine sediment metagenome]|uniref:Uncharacterized protein n=1 Tax=marine sediment metagenome TaxID=412755 RepID=A0A0F9T6X5_9ZZZZ
MKVIDQYSTVLKPQFESWPNMIWTAFRHWFFKFKMCDGCKMDIREKWNPTPLPDKEGE